MRIDVIVVGQMEVNCYVVSSEKTRNAALIDPGDDYARIEGFLSKQNLKAGFIVHTHGHIDHIQADNDFNLPIYVHRLDAELLNNPLTNLSGFLSMPLKVRGDIRPLEDSEKLGLDDISLEVIHTPGHTPGGICLKANGIIFTGDTLFAEGIGRTDFPGASQEQLLMSIRNRLLIFPDDTIIYPGHGASSTIGHERMNNPFL